MPKELHRQNAWNSGELDPDLLGRIDVKEAANAAALIENCLTLPQGPLVQRPGFAHVDVARHPLETVDASGAALTAPEGGTAADALTADGTPLLTTTDLALTDGYVVVTFDFGAPVTVGAVDLIDYGLHATAGGGTPPGTVPIGFPWGSGVGGGGWYNGRGVIP